jgi:hypothetical protein
MSQRLLGYAAALLIVSGCHDQNATSNTATATDRAQYTEQTNTQMRQSISEVTDVMFKQAAAANEVWKDTKVTDAIRQYEALSPADRARFIVDNKAALNSVRQRFDDDDNKLQRALSRLPSFPDLFDKGRPADFNLAMAKTDVYARQIKLTNELFGDAGSEVVSAVEGYEKLTPQQKQAFFVTPDAKAYILYWQYVYVWQKVWLLQNYRLYAYQTEWGYKVPISPEKRAELDDRQFDLKNKTFAR